MTNTKSINQLAFKDIRAGVIPFIITVVLVYALSFTFWRGNLRPEDFGLLTVLGIGYLLVGIAFAGCYARRTSSLALIIFFALEISLGGYIVYRMCEFFLAGILLLPLVGLAVETLPRRWMLVISAFIVIALSSAYGLPGGWEAAILSAIGYLSAIVFVISMTQIAARERQTRAEKEQLVVALESANDKLREYATQAEELAITRERARLAHALHDTVGHTLTTLDVQLELLTRLPPGQTEMLERILEQARSLVKTGLTDVRRAVQALQPIALEHFSVLDAIGDLVTIFEECNLVSVDYHTEGEIVALPQELALLLYRAAQETLTNIQRHAPEAEQVSLRLSYSPEEVVFTVENNGLPPDAQENQLEGGHGLNGLRQRTEIVGGEFQAGPDENGWFRVEICLNHDQSRSNRAAVSTES